MGIDGIDILKPDEFTPVPKVREGEVVSRHIINQGAMRYVFGWDQPLQSFFYQVHDTTRDEYAQIVAQMGTTADTVLPEVTDLVRAAAENGLLIGATTKGQLQAEKDRGL